jgi:YggT family protein
MVTVGGILLALLSIYEWILIIRAVLSWVQVINPRWTPHGVLLVVAEATFTVTDPPLRFLRKLIKPLRVGNIRLDLAFFVLFCLVLVCAEAVQRVFL